MRMTASIPVIRWVFSLSLFIGQQLRIGGFGIALPWQLERNRAFSTFMANRKVEDAIPRLSHGSIE